ncbi:MAG: 50S ribosomal protein L22 [Planctomycetota bacterium]
MDYSATLRYARITPRKLRLVADLIRGKNVTKALDTLHFCSKRGAYFLQKLLRSAVSNATQNPEVNTDRLFIKQIMVGDGPIIKRSRAASMGRSSPLKKRTSHVTINLTEIKKTKPAPVPPKKEAGPAKKIKSQKTEPLKETPDDKPAGEVTENKK